MKRTAKERSETIGDGAILGFLLYLLFHILGFFF